MLDSYFNFIKTVLYSCVILLKGKQRDKQSVLTLTPASLAEINNAMQFTFPVY